MIAIVLVLSVFCVVAIVAARYVPMGSGEFVIGCTFIFLILSCAFLILSCAVWVQLLMFNVVPVDAIARRSFGTYDLQPWLGTVIYAPPLIGTAAFAATLWRKCNPR